MAKKDETSIVPTDSMDNLPAKAREMYAEDAKENLENVTDSFHPLSIKGGRFNINGEMAGRDGIAFTGVILREAPVNMFYVNGYDPDSPTPPASVAPVGQWPRHHPLLKSAPYFPGGGKLLLL